MTQTKAQKEAKKYSKGSFTDANFPIEEVVQFAYLAGWAAATEEAARVAESFNKTPMRSETIVAEEIAEKIREDGK